MQVIPEYDYKPYALASLDQIDQEKRQLLEKQKSDPTKGGNAAMKLAKLREEASVNDSYKDYIVSFALAPGEYTLSHISGNYRSLLVNGFYHIPFHQDISISPDENIYLGHIDATMVKRTHKNQLRAGPSIPLIDQNFIGAASGTFIFNIESRFETDLKLAKSIEPSIENIDFVDKTFNQWISPNLEESIANN